MDLENGQITIDSEMFAKTLILANIQEFHFVYLPPKFKVLANNESTYLWRNLRNSGYFRFLSISDSGEELELLFSAELKTNCLA